MKSKLIATFILISAALILCVSVSAKGDTDDWQTAYADFLRSCDYCAFDGSLYEQPPVQSFALYDLDGDGLPELVFDSSDAYEIYSYQSGIVKKLCRLDGDIREVIAPHDENALYFHKITLGDGYHEEAYFSLGYADGTVDFRTIGLVHDEYSSGERYLLDDGTQVSQEQFAAALDMRCGLHMTPVSETAVAALIDEYYAAAPSNATVAVYYKSEGDVGSVAYSDGLEFAAASPDTLFPLIMVNGTFVDNSSILIENGTTYVTAAFLRMNLRLDIADDDASLRLGDKIFESHMIAETEYFPLRVIAQRLGYSCDYFDDIEYFNNLHRDEKITLIVIDSIAADEIRFDSTASLELAVALFDETYLVEDTTLPDELSGDRLYADGMLGRYHIIRMAVADVNYFMLVNAVTGEVYERAYGLPLAQIKAISGSLFWLYQ